MWAALHGSGLAGGIVAAQSRVNGGLSQGIGNGYVAAVISFGSGLVLLVLVVLLSEQARHGLRQVRTEIRAKRFPVWALTGGFCGAFFVLGQGLVASVIGLALFTVGIVAGQVFGGLVIDRFGLGPGGRVRPTVQRMIGTGLAVLAVLLAVAADIANAGAGRVDQLWLVVIPVIAGLGVSWQSTVNGLVRAAAHSAVTATFINFVVGTSVLVLIAVVSVATQGFPEVWPSNPWLYIGGPIGVVFIAIAAMLVRTAGVLLLSMSNVAGQLVASVAFDAGLPLAGGVTPGLLAGAAVALIAVAIAALPSRTIPPKRA